MCFTKNLSLTSFLFGIFSSVMLILFGNKDYYYANLAIGYFFIYVTLMQLVEYFIWSDLKCKNGLNKFASITGPLLNHFQPVIALILFNIYLKSNNIIPNNVLFILNIIYIIYVFYIYFIYIQKKENLCVGLNKEKHLDWNWKYSFNYVIYWIIILINVINYINNINVLLFSIISVLFFIISYYNFHYNIGELWCLMVTGVPLIILFIQKVFDIRD
jgi:hypothetical protein